MISSSKINKLNSLFNDQTTCNEESDVYRYQYHHNSLFSFFFLV